MERGEADVTKLFTQSRDCSRLQHDVRTHGPYLNHTRSSWSCRRDYVRYVRRYKYMLHMSTARLMFNLSNAYLSQRSSIKYTLKSIKIVMKLN